MGKGKRKGKWGMLSDWGKGSDGEWDWKGDVVLGREMDGRTLYL